MVGRRNIFCQQTTWPRWRKTEYFLICGENDDVIQYDVIRHNDNVGREKSVNTHKNIYVHMYTIVEHTFNL